MRPCRNSAACRGSVDPSIATERSKELSTAEVAPMGKEICTGMMESEGMGSMGAEMVMPSSWQKVSIASETVDSPLFSMYAVSDSVSPMAIVRGYWADAMRSDGVAKSWIWILSMQTALEEGWVLRRRRAMRI